MVIKQVELQHVCGITSKLPDTGQVEVAFAGKSNVGKSSLINALMNRKSLARTSAQPGKTQTINYYHINEEMYLVDLPGYGFARASEEVKAKWGKLIEDYLHQSKMLHAVFLLIDIRHAPSNNDRIMYNWILRNGYQPIIIATKLDKIKRSQLQKQIKLIRETLEVEKDTIVIPFSAETKQGREEIWNLIDEIRSDAEESGEYVMGMIRAAGLGYEYLRYEEEGQEPEVTKAIEDVSLEIQKGQFIAVLGHNGSGKSTLAKHINALLVPTEGTMWVDDMKTTDEEDVWKIRQKAGMVFQNPDNQIIGNVVEEDVGFGPENLGVPTDEIWKRVEESLTATGMISYRAHSPNKLSGGQKQRVAIAGVMAMQPECIVLDEPTAMLDPNGRKEVLRAVRKLNEEKGVTVILITHYMEEVVFADRVFVMDNGKLVMQGTPREIFSEVEKLKELRLDVPQVTLLAYELRKNGVDLPEGILTIEELVNALCH